MNKKFTFGALALTCLMTAAPINGYAQDPVTPESESVYDFDGFKEQQMLDIFYEALTQGKKYPDAAAFTRIGISQGDLAFVRSHVRKQNVLSADGRLISKTFAGRKLWMNTPMGSGAGADAGYPSKVFHNDVFSLWNYTALWGSWNHGIFQAPGSWVDAAHKNGTDILCGIKFFDAASGEHSGGYANIVNTKDDSEYGYAGFKYVKPLIHLLKYIGADGYNINWESGSPNTCKEFHKAAYRYAKDIGFNDFHIGLYTTQHALSDYNLPLYYEDGQVSDLMLNYGGEYSLSRSVQTAKSTPIGASSLWQGFWIQSMNQNWTYLDTDANAHEGNICLWGEHKMSRFWSYNSGSDDFEAQNNYQWLLERAFSGGNRNPLLLPEVSNYGNEIEWKGTTPPLSTFCGFANWIPERATVQGHLPFITHFNLGNGKYYSYKGITTAGSYYNMASQDVVPTYRWLVTEAGQENTLSTAIDPAFTHKDSYIGGSSLELKGDAGKSTDIILYRTNIQPNTAGVYANIAIKGADHKATDVKSCLYLILRTASGQWKEYAVPDNKGANTWQEHKIELSDLAATDVIDRIGLRVKGGDNKYDMYVGKLEINDANKIAVAGIQALEVEKKEETTQTMSFKLNWEVNHVADEYGMVFNDAAGIDHFQILYKNAEGGKIREIARTTQWAAFIGDVLLEEGDVPYIGVRSVSKDLKSYSEVAWQKVDRNPNAPEPLEINTYGISEMNPNCEGADIARRVRYVDLFKTEGAVQNINYTAASPQADGTQYVRVTDHKLIVKQGQKVKFTLKGYEATDDKDGNHDDLRWCFAGGWIDLDGSGNYNHPKSVKDQYLYIKNTTEYDLTSSDGTDPLGERVFKVGTLRGATMSMVQGGLTGEFEIPEDAHLGESRLRIVFSDAWFAGEFLPVGLHNKGFSIDFDVEIQGDNVEGQRGAIDTRDKGEAEEPEGFLTPNAISSVAGEAPSVVVVADGVRFSNVDEAWVYSADGVLVKHLFKPSSVSAREFRTGVYLVKVQNKDVIRTQKLMIK